MEKVLGDLAVGAMKQFSLVELVRTLKGDDKSRRLKEALEHPTLSPCARELIEEELNSVLTRETTRIVGGKVKREKIRELVAQARGELLIDHLARASPRLVIKSGKLVADVSRSDGIGLVIGNTLGFSVVLLGVAGLMSPLILKTLGHDVGTAAGLLLMLQGVLVSMFGLFLLAQLDSLRMAKMIGPSLEELQREQTVAVQAPE